MNYLYVGLPADLTTKYSISVDSDAWSWALLWNIWLRKKRPLSGTRISHCVSRVYLSKSGVRRLLDSAARFCTLTYRCVILMDGNRMTCISRLMLWCNGFITQDSVSLWRFRNLLSYILSICAPIVYVNIFLYHSSCKQIIIGNKLLTNECVPLFSQLLNTRLAVI